MNGSGLPQRLVAEALGTAFLLAAVVGSGIMAERLAGGNVAVALLANTGATVAALIALILCFAPISGAHFNPIVTLALAMRRDLAWRDVGPYVAVQLIGAIAGVLAAHAMFDLPLVTPSTKARAGLALAFSEFVATLGLLAVIWIVSLKRADAVAYAVGGWIGAGYWFTASTSFANPAVTIARALSDSFAGIRPADAPGFIAAQLVALVAAVVLLRWLMPASVRGNSDGPSTPPGAARS